MFLVSKARVASTGLQWHRCLRRCINTVYVDYIMLVDDWCTYANNHVQQCTLIYSTHYLQYYVWYIQNNNSKYQFAGHGLDPYYGAVIVMAPTHWVNVFEYVKVMIIKAYKCTMMHQNPSSIIVKFFRINGFVQHWCTPKTGGFALNNGYEIG